MFQHILVPLDGSRRAESALPVAVNIARSTGASLLLLHVIPQPMQLPGYALRTADLPEEESASDAYNAALLYLSRIRRSKGLQNLPVETYLVTGPVPQRILFSIEAQAIDLVVMCSRGATGFKRWTLGSVAQKIASHSRVPVLLLHEAAGTLSNQHPAGRRPVRVLAALDGSPLAETILKPAAALSIALSAPEPGAMHLLNVVPPPRAMALPGVGAPQLDIAEARLYLQMTAQAVQEQLYSASNLTIRTSIAEESACAEAIVRVAEGLTDVEACDAIALASPGRTGLVRQAMGSMAERLLERTRLPLLLAHAPWPADRESRPGEWALTAQRKSGAASGAASHFRQY
jgi:nucleotide-binding universal stress UspA family protein